SEITLSSFISFEQSFRGSASVIKIALTNLSFSIGDPDGSAGPEAPLFQLSGLSGLFFITPQGMAASIQSPNYDHTFTLSGGASIRIAGNLAVEVNTTNDEVHETFIIDSAGNTRTLNLDKGPSLRLSGSLTLEVTDPGLGNALTLSGDFAFEQIPLPQLGPTAKGIRIGATNVELTVLG